MPRSIIPSILLVDGYNIIGAWPCLKKTRDDAGLESERAELYEAITNYIYIQFELISMNFYFYSKISKKKIRQICLECIDVKFI